MVYYRQNGIGSVGSFQVSGVPYITGAVIPAGEEHRIQFPTVAKSVVVVNKDADVDSNDKLYVHFNATGSGEVISGYHYFPLDANDANMTFNVKCKEIYISNPNASDSSQYFVIAELTGIQAEDMFQLTGSGLTDSEQRNHKCLLISLLQM